jgi:hypothetical protein
LALVDTGPAAKVGLVTVGDRVKFIPKMENFPYGWTYRKTGTHS